MKIKELFDKSKDTLLFIVVCLLICVVAVYLDSLFHKDKEMGLEYSHIQDMIYSLDENSFFVEYDDVFDNKKEYIILDVEENDFVSLSEAYNTWDYDKEKSFRIKKIYVSDVNDYRYEILTIKNKQL